MKKLRGSFAAKLAAVILLCVMVLACLGSVYGVGVLYEWGAYSSGYETALSQAVDRLGWRHLYSAWNAYMVESDPDVIDRGTNFRFTVLGPEGEELYSDYQGEGVLWQTSMSVVPDYEAAETANRYRDPAVTVTPTPAPVPTGAPESAEQSAVPEIRIRNFMSGETIIVHSYDEVDQWVRENRYTIRGYVLADLAQQDEFSRQADLLKSLWGIRYALIWAAAISLLIGVLLFIFLMSAAGHRRDSDEITESFADRIPLDLFTVLIVGAEALVYAAILGPGWSFDAVGIAAVLLLGLLAGLIFLFWCMSFAVRVKRGTLWQNCLIARLWRWCVKVIRGFFRLLGKGLRALPLLGRWAAILCGAAALELLILILSNGEAATVFWLLNTAAGLPLLLYAVWCFRGLRVAAKEIAAGDLNVRADDSYLVGAFKEHAEDLNHIRDGLNAAVEERMKSERLRTELITNVSHDIKTPLTSIVNYVDLLAREEPESETVREYVDVLSRQSARLKKLIDDLIEASKASTGSLPVQKERCELGVLIDQAVGEYAEKLREKSLNLLVSKPEEPVAVLADGRHLWRIFDNLLSNVCKYAMPGTRVYLDLTAEDGRAEVTLRNISEKALNVSGAELMERFVRGESSRSTEGSGLGLSIALSLAKLQGAQMDITVDGDLFKVRLDFDTV